MGDPGTPIQDSDLTGKIVVITGGSMGIGFACAEVCLRAGARVMICARTEKPLRDAITRLHERGYVDIKAKVADVTKVEDIKALLEVTIKEYGSLDGLIHCAAVLGPVGPMTDVESEPWFDAIHINLYGTFLVTRLACRQMMTRGGGRIVIFSGGGAASPFPNYTAYGCGKAAVVRLAETLAQEVRPFNIQVNCIAPGFVVTKMHEGTLAAGEKAGREYLDRTRREIESGGVPASLPARTAAFLLSDRAKGITGKLVASVHDGWEAWPDHLEELQQTDIFTLRRILPKDRGMNWQ